MCQCDRYIVKVYVVELMVVSLKIWYQKTSKTTGVDHLLFMNIYYSY